MRNGAISHGDQTRASFIQPSKDARRMGTTRRKETTPQQDRDRGPDSYPEHAHNKYAAMLEGFLTVINQRI